MERMPATTVTWRDVLEMPEDGNRYEAIGGELYVSPPPRPPHQWVSANLFHELWNVLVRAGLGRLFYAPIGVEFAETEEGVQPDILFVSKERLHIVTEDGIQGAPDLVIEILSPSTARRDRTVKRHLYERQGVAEYWIVDWRRRQIDCYRRDGDVLALAGTLGETDVLQSPLLPEFSCPVRDLFERLSR